MLVNGSWVGVLWRRSQLVEGSTGTPGEMVLCCTPDMTQGRSHTKQRTQQTTSDALRKDVSDRPETVMTK